MQEHKIEERNTYNMDEKGFFVGIAHRRKRIFSKAVWESGERTAAMRDGNREWVTLLACVCASGEALPPALIYQGISGVQSSWVDDLLAEQHQIFVSHSASGWSNNDLGLAWLQQVFERFTAAKARRQWRLLILDGHASHLTPDFLDYCEAKRIMVMVYPPHSTHSLQPLDVVLFSPLSKRYTEELTQRLHRTQGISRITKRDFYSNFWPAWSSTMTHDLILKSFQATGVWPMDAEPVLQRWNNQPQQQDDELEIGEQGDGDTWPQLRKIFDAAVADKAKIEAKRLSQGLHSLQVNNELLRLQNAELRAELNLMRSRPSKSTTLTTQEGDEWHGGAVFYSPRKLASLRARKAAELDEAAEQQLQKARDRERKAAEAAKKKRSQEASKVARQQAKIAKDAEQLRQREEKAAARERKKQQQQATTPKKTHDTANKPHGPSARTRKRAHHHIPLENKNINLLKEYGQLLDDYKVLKIAYKEKEKELVAKSVAVATPSAPAAASSSRNPYVLMLVDGNDYIFNDELIREKEEGGMRAARMLNDAVEKYLQQNIPKAQSARIIVRIYADLTNLSKQLARSKVSGLEKRSIAPFSAAFTRTMSLFDFVDALDEEGCKLKIREQFKIASEDTACSHIFYAACSSPAYLSQLAPFSGQRDKITLVQGAGWNPEFHQFILNVTQFSTIFRLSELPIVAPNSKSTPSSTTPNKQKAPVQKPVLIAGLPNSRKDSWRRNGSMSVTDSAFDDVSPTESSGFSEQERVGWENKSAYNTQAGKAAASKPPPAKDAQQQCKYFKKGFCRFGDKCNFQHIPKGLDGGASSSSRTGSNQATLKPEEPHDIFSSQDSQTTPARKTPHTHLLPKGSIPGLIPLNKSLHRLDTYAPAPSAAAWTLYTTRFQARKPCNTFHLSGPSPGQKAKGCRFKPEAHYGAEECQMASLVPAEEEDVEDEVVVGEDDSDEGLSKGHGARMAGVDMDSLIGLNGGDFMW
ncbi:hypothetical protein TW65_08484 [Stemphylium lycopersici]|nr:hypothetical protein TW65_08484 [Stemphylium lycopersici]